MLRKLLLLVFLLGLAAPLAACGKKSSPKQPDDATYPRQYPTR